ncbi:MAG: hypothetical protein QOH17_667 [Pseudonocardiales bacterium]|jgi:hypothetical protein|nr:hypothetical protein [Pseudonocardiales bacterium]MDT7574334.1 hypothetical protein [Pseudonocardiales bacterium]
MFESAHRLPAPPVVQTVTVTCTLDSRAHAVHDSQLATALESGRYNALCGHLVTAAPLTEPDGLPCLLCEELRYRPVDRRRHRGLRWVR